MRKTALVIVILAIVSVAAWFYVTKATGSLRLKMFVPAESSVVISLNLNSLNKKIDGKKSKELAMVQDLLQKNQGMDFQPFIKNLTENPGSSGIRFTEQPIYFLLSGESGKRKSSGLLFGIKNEEKFLSFLKSSGMKTPISALEETKYLLNDLGLVLIWNAKTALLYMDATGMPQVEIAMAMLSGKAPSIDDNDLFKESYIKGRDVNLYLNTSRLSPSQDDILTPNALKPKGAVAYGIGIRFEDGKIELESKMAFENNKDAKLLKLFRQDPGEEFLAYSSKSRPLVAMQIQLNPDKLYTLLNEDKKLKASMQEVAADLGVEARELKELFTGDIAFSFSGIETRLEKRNYFGTERVELVNSFQAVLFVAVKNHTLFQKLLDKNKNNPLDGKYDFTIPFLGNYYMVYTPAGISIMMDEPLAKELAKEKILSDNDFGELGSYFRENPNAAYINLNLDSMPLAVTDYLKNDLKEEYDILQVACKPLERAFFHQSKNKGSIKLEFKNKKENSLMQLLQVSNSLYLKQLEIEKSRNTVSIPHEPTIEKPEEMMDIH